MNGVPVGIKNKQTFIKSTSALSDGFFDFEFLRGCFGQTKIMPTDIDGIIERKKQFLIFETKIPNTPLPIAQKILLRRFYDEGNKTIIYMEAAEIVEKYCFVWAKNLNKPHIWGIGQDNLTELIKEWFSLVDK